MQAHARQADGLRLVARARALDVELLRLSEAWRWVVDPSAALRSIAEREGWPIRDGG